MAEVLRWVTGVVCNYNTSELLVKRHVTQLMAGVDPWNTAPRRCPASGGAGQWSIQPPSGPQGVPMIKSARGAVVSVLAATLWMGAAVAQEKTSLSTDRDKVSYAVGLDVAHAIAPVAQDMDAAAFEQGIRNAFAGGKPAMGKEEAVATDHALRARVAARMDKSGPGA